MTNMTIHEQDRQGYEAFYANIKLLGLRTIVHRVPSLPVVVVEELSKCNVTRLRIRANASLHGAQRGTLGVVSAERRRIALVAWWNLICGVDGSRRHRVIRFL